MVDLLPQDLEVIAERVRKKNYAGLLERTHAELATIEQIHPERIQKALFDGIRVLAGAEISDAVIKTEIEDYNTERKRLYEKVNLLHCKKLFQYSFDYGIKNKFFLYRSITLNEFFQASQKLLEIIEEYEEPTAKDIFIALGFQKINLDSIPRYQIPFPELNEYRAGITFKTKGLIGDIFTRSKYDVFADITSLQLKIYPNKDQYSQEEVYQLEDLHKKLKAFKI